MDTVPIEGKYHKSNRYEYQLKNTPQNIKLSFPSLADYLIHRARRTCMKIDHCQIEYRPLVPYNITGQVLIEIHDTRLNIDDSRQAWFKFPIRAHIRINFFSGSYFSVKDSIPWKAKLIATGTNMNTGTRFCSIKARLKLSTEKHSTEIAWKSPSLELISKDVANDEVNFEHVERAPPALAGWEQGAITVNDNAMTHSIRLPLTLEQGRTYQQTLRSTSSRHSIAEDTRAAEDITPMVTPTHRRAQSHVDNLVHITPATLADIVKKASSSNPCNKET